jgi:two-component system NtrC family sensor kinase
MLGGSDSNLERELEAIRRVGELMARVVDMRELLAGIMAISKRVAQAEASAILLYDEAADELYFDQALGERREAVKRIRLKANQGIAGSCAQTREIIVVQDCAKDERHAKFVDQSTAFQTRNLIATPLIRGGKLLGVLEVLNKSGGRDFSDEDVRLVRFFGDQAAIALENGLLVETAMRNERLAAAGEAVLGASHYIKNILMGLKGSASLIEMGLKKDNFDMVKTSWPIVERSLLKISNLSRDMLAYAKDREPDYASVNAGALLEDIARSVRASAKEAGVEITVSAAEGLDAVEIDETRIHDAVLNLVVNALDACREIPAPPGEGKRVALSARPLSGGFFCSCR